VCLCRDGETYRSSGCIIRSVAQDKPIPQRVSQSPEDDDGGGKRSRRRALSVAIPPYPNLPAINRRWRWSRFRIVNQSYGIHTRLSLAENAVGTLIIKVISFAICTCRDAEVRALKCDLPWLLLWYYITVIHTAVAAVEYYCVVASRRTI
jgi:hypothetical protein